LCLWMKSYSVTTQLKTGNQSKKVVRGKGVVKNSLQGVSFEGADTTVQSNLFIFSNYSALLAMELNVSKEITCK